MILVALLYAVLALTFIFAKNALAYANPFFLIGFRMLIAGTILLSYQYIFQRKHFVAKRSDWWLFFRVSVFHIYLAFVLEFWALQYLSALKTTIIYSATPFIAAILSYFLLSEKLTIKKTIGIGVGLLGLIPVLTSQVGDVATATSGRFISMPEIVLFGAVVSASYAWFLVKELMQKGYGLGMINGIAMLVGGFMSMITAGFFEGFTHPVSNWSGLLFWLVLLILSANIIVYNFYGWLLQRYSITFVSFAGFLCPCFGTLYEWLFMDGQITWQHLASMILITIGLYIFYRDELKKNKDLHV